MRKALDDKLSIAADFDEATSGRANSELHYYIAQIFQIEYTVGPYVHAERFHDGIIRSRLTLSFSGFFDDIKDEIFQKFSDNIISKDSGMWQALY